jgi:hypothetical protein
LPEGAGCSLEFDDDAMIVIKEPPLSERDVAIVRFGEVTSLNIGGRGEVTSTTGGGWIGGGFGAAGILEGPLWPRS